METEGPQSNEINPAETSEEKQPAEFERFGFTPTGVEAPKNKAGNYMMPVYHGDPEQGGLKEEWIYNEDGSVSGLKNPKTGEIRTAEEWRNSNN